MWDLTSVFTPLRYICNIHWRSGIADGLSPPRALHSERLSHVEEEFIIGGDTRSPVNIADRGKYKGIFLPMLIHFCQAGQQDSF